MNRAEFQADTPYASFGSTVIEAPVDARRTFIRKTYAHLAAAVYAFVAIEWVLFQTGFPDLMFNLLGQSQYSWLIVLGAFMGVSWIADRWARSDTSAAMQYAGLFLYVLAQAVIFVPLIAMALNSTFTSEYFGQVGVLPAAAWTTLITFGGLTAFVFLTKKDFSFLQPFLAVVMIGAMALIGASIIFGFSLGIFFVWAMIVAACGYILYYTSNVLHEYRTDQYVAASLALFAAVALLFWYVIQLFLANRD